MKDKLKKNYLHSKINLVRAALLLTDLTRPNPPHAVCPNRIQLGSITQSERERPKDWSTELG